MSMNWDIITKDVTIICDAEDAYYFALQVFDNEFTECGSKMFSLTTEQVENMVMFALRHLPEEKQTKLVSLIKRYDFESDSDPQDREQETL